MFSKKINELCNNKSWPKETLYKSPYWISILEYVFILVFFVLLPLSNSYSKDIISLEDRKATDDSWCVNNKYKNETCLTIVITTPIECDLDNKCILK